MHAADGATKRRETADFDPARLWTAEIERANLRVEKLISICFMAESLLRNRCVPQKRLRIGYSTDPVGSHPGMSDKDDEVTVAQDMGAPAYRDTPKLDSDVNIRHTFCAV